MVVAPISHVSLDDVGTAFISGTSIKVSDIVIDAYTWKLSAEQIQENYPSLSLGEIHSALAYYHDHRGEMDRRLVQLDEEYHAARASAKNLSRKDFEKRLNFLPL